MANENLSTPSKTRNYQILTQKQSNGKNLVDDIHTNGISSTGNHPTSKLPSLLSKSSVFPSTSDTVRVKRYRSPQKDILTASSLLKIERQSTNIITQTRLPALNTMSNDNEHRKKSDPQRRQIYALNHLMRELEQEQFRQFCKLNAIGNVNTEEILPTTEESTNEEPTT